VLGPAWIKNRRFDIHATLAPGTSPDLVWPALQTLLAERLELSIRREKQERPVYALTVAKDGPKLRAASSVPPGAFTFQPGSRDGMRPRSGESDSATLRLESVSVAKFCADVSRSANRPVLDRTGIAGRFDIELHYGRHGGNSASSLAAALQKQLGLKLEPDRQSIDMLIVENALRKPAVP
jgi:uncharacterized protein (TIGR03435 family)